MTAVQLENHFGAKEIIKNIKKDVEKKAAEKELKNQYNMRYVLIKWQKKVELNRKITLYLKILAEDRCGGTNTNDSTTYVCM